jgi:cytochrome c-type biogenesis protein CcmH
MILWIAMAALAAAVCLPLLVALRRAPGEGGERAAVDIYRDQLGELTRDRDRGLIPGEEAEAARVEIARRLIRADAATRRASSPSDRGLRLTAAVVVVAMPIAAVGLYVALGSPSLPDQPLAARLSAPLETQDIALQIARMDQYLAQHPEDGRAWEVIAPVYTRVGRVADAVVAYGNAIRFLGDTPDREVKLGLVLVAAADGVTDEAVSAFRRAAALAPGDPGAHVYLARALEEQGKAGEAVAVWRQLLANAAPDAPWMKDAQAEIARLGQQAPGEPPAATAGGRPAGPTPPDVAAIQDLPPEQRTAMIEGMVASLATRLETNSSDAQGWAQLVRSYVVLGRADQARAALAKARTALASDKDKTAIVEEAARSVGLGP